MESVHRVASQMRPKLARARWTADRAPAVLNTRLLMLAERWVGFWSKAGLTSALCWCIPRRGGIGSENSHAADGATVALLALPGGEAFYERHGFTRCPNAVFGQALAYLSPIQRIFHRGRPDTEHR